MNKKLLVVSIVAVFILVAISFSTAVSSNTVKTVERKESPLFGIRTRQAIKEKIGDIIENIKTKYIGERAFFLPFQLLRIKNTLRLYTGGSEPECDRTFGVACTEDVTCTSDMWCTAYCK